MPQTKQARACLDRLYAGPVETTSTEWSINRYERFAARFLSRRLPELERAVELAGESREMGSAWRVSGASPAVSTTWDHLATTVDRMFGWWQEWNRIKPPPSHRELHEFIGGALYFGLESVLLGYLLDHDPNTDSPSWRDTAIAAWSRFDGCRKEIRQRLGAPLNYWTVLRRLAAYMNPYRLYVAGYVLFTLALTGVSLLEPWPLRYIVDSLLTGEEIPAWLPSAGGRVALLALLVAAYFGIKALLAYIHRISEYLSTKVALSMAQDFRGDVFEHLQKLSLRFHDERHSGDSAYRVMQSTHGAAGVYMWGLIPMLTSGLMVAGMLAIIYTLDWQLGIVVSCVVPLVILAIRYYGTHIETRSYEVGIAEGAALSTANEVVGGIRAVKAFGQERREQRRFWRQSLDALQARLGVTRQELNYAAAVQVGLALAAAGVLFLGALHVMQGTLTLGELLIVTSYLATVSGPLTTASGGFSTMALSAGECRRAFELLDAFPEVISAPGAGELGRVRGALEFRNVSFSYRPEEPVLSEVSLKVSPGEVVGIVGETGAGKSTLVSLVLRFFEVEEGAVLVDGHDVREVKLSSLRCNVAYILQDPMLFSGTIAQNIAYGKPGAGPDEVRTAARAAAALGFIERLPEGFETEIGERGVLLSGGERQRIGIARAFLKDAPILILDEPTAAVDAETERHIFSALDRLSAGRTTLVIAHRLSTIRRADRIVVLDQGRVSEVGSHEELMASGRAYRRLVELQFGGGLT